MKIVNALLLAGSAQAFAPQASLATSKSALYDAATETATEMLDSSRASQPASSAFCNGLVGGEGPEPMPFISNGERTSVNFDPLGFTEVRWSVWNSRVPCLQLTICFRFVPKSNRGRRS